jgi:hypothetical protein
MAGTKRKLTERGIGAVHSSRPPERVSGIVPTGEPRASEHDETRPEPRRDDHEDDRRPFAMRDTLPAPAFMPAPPQRPPPLHVPSDTKRGPSPWPTEGLYRAHETTSMGATPGPTPAPASGVSASALASSAPPPASAPPASSSPGGRYSSQPREEDAPATGPRRALEDSLRRAARQPLRVDTVGPTMIVAPHDAARTARPRVVGRARTEGAALSAREARLLSLVDGARAVHDLVDAAAMPEREVLAILARLVRLGIVSLTS